jgi:hypothetical protein
MNPVASLPDVKSNRVQLHSPLYLPERVPVMALRPPCRGLFFEGRSLIFHSLKLGHGCKPASLLMFSCFKVMAAMFDLERYIT